MIKTICVCGSGTMGTGIAQLAASGGFFTILYDISRNRLSVAEETIHKALANLVGKSRISESEKQETINRIHFTDNLNDCSAELLIEAINEDINRKAELFSSLTTVNSRNAIFATNTSSLSVSAMAGMIQYPGRFAGMHFFNPAPVMKLVEIVKGIHTTKETISTLFEVAKQMGKTAVLCSDSPGFIVNRVARPYYLEALHLLETNIAGIETIDQILESTGFKMGPFRLMDLIGNDINLAVSNSVYEALQKPSRLKPSVLQQEKVKAGELGRKSGKGFYEY